MNGFEGMLFATILLTFLAGVFALIYKDSRPPQPVTEYPTTHRKAIVASLIPGACAAILYATFKGLDLYLPDHLQMQRLTAMLVIVLGVVAPWCVGIYFGYRTARAANKVLRAIGSMEVLIFLIAAAVPVVARG
jgi:membrane protein CcdC involved in cytochrome C biogenesis